MTYIKINDTLYPATISGRMEDREWDKRESKAITLEMDYATAMALFVDGLAWSIVAEMQIPVTTANEDGTTTTQLQEKTEEYDNSDYCVAGPVTDNRDGTVTVKMGKYTNEEQLLSTMRDELAEAYNEGVQEA